MLKERPILMSASMVIAILTGRKTQTRRAITPQPEPWEANPAFLLWKNEHFFPGDPKTWVHPCPYGQPGDRLWVREAWRPTAVCGTEWTSVHYRADGAQRDCAYFKPNLARQGWRPSIHMPRVASRLSIEVTGVRVERLFEITEADARAEGIFREGKGWVHDTGQPQSISARRAYEDLWYSINGAWLDCWVWVVSFKRVP